MSPLDRLMNKVAMDPESGCWEWTASLLTSGYGAFFMDGQMTGAHRASYLLHRGDIADGREIDHLCRNKRCVNPEHLEAVTHSVNMRRVNGETHCRRGHLRCEENRLHRSDDAYACRLCHRIHRRAHAARQSLIRKAAGRA